jgi:hypothetical protein
MPVIKIDGQDYDYDQPAPKPPRKQLQCRSICRYRTGSPRQPGGSLQDSPHAGYLNALKQALTSPPIPAPSAGILSGDTIKFD